MNPKAIKMRRPLVQNRNEENGRSPFSEWRFPLVRPCRVSESKWAVRPAGLFVSQWVSVCVQGLSSIAPDRRSRSGRLRSQKMRQSVGTTMALVTWRHVSRVTRHVPPREPFEKFSNTPAAQTGGVRDPKLSGQKALGRTGRPVCVFVGQSVDQSVCVSKDFRQ